MAMSNRLNHINMDDTHKLLELATVLDLNIGLPALRSDLERPTRGSEMCRLTKGTTLTSASCHAGPRVRHTCDQ